MFKKKIILPVLFAYYVSAASCVSVYGAEAEENVVMELNTGPDKDMTGAGTAEGTGIVEETASYGWEREGDLFRYKDKNGKYLTGWQFLPVFGTSEKQKWFFFNKEGFLFSSFSPISRSSQQDPLCSPLLVGRIRPAVSADTEYEYTVLEQGWYGLAFEGNAGYSSVFDEDLYIKSYGNDEYGICRFEDGKYLFLGYDRQGGGISFADDAGGDAQRWSVIKNRDSSLSFINIAAGMPLGLSGGAPALSLYEEGNTDQMIGLRGKNAARPEYYGAVGDGISDDTEAVKYAVNNNPEVIFTGRYNTSSCIVIKKSDVTLSGEKGTMITHPEFRTFEVRGKNVTFDSLNFEGDYSAENSSNYSCIFIRTLKGDDPVVDYNTMIKNCSFIKTGLRGVHLHSERVSDSDFTPASIVSNVTVRNCVFDTYTIGVCCSGPDYVTVDNCSFENARYEHVTFDWRTRHALLENSVFNGPDSGVGCVGIDSAEDCLVKDNTFNYSVFYGITLNNELGTNSNIVIDNNKFEYTGGQGGIRFREELSDGVAAENVTITNNTFDTGDSYSVIIKSAGENIMLSGNKYNDNVPVIYSGDTYIIKDYQ